ncbi:MAG: hypothetical protein IPG56_20465 [Caulobacteraceae bacterium]|nr:hypothetical protein [Caulobacteraceae bacterium]
MQVRLSFIRLTGARLSEWVISEIAYAQHNRVPIIVAEVNAVLAITHLRFWRRKRQRSQDLAAQHDSTRKLLTTTRQVRRGDLFSLFSQKAAWAKNRCLNVFFTRMRKAGVAGVLLIDLDPQHNLTQMILPQGEMTTFKTPNKRSSAPSNRAKSQMPHRPLQISPF